MNNNYYKLPINAQALIKSKTHGTCDISNSIANNIHLIATSYFGECSFDDTYGCSIWNIDFDNLKSTNKLKSIIEESLFESLKRHEKRLSKIAITVKIRQEEINPNGQNNRIKKRVDIVVKGKIKKIDENFSYIEYFFIGPLSY
ncbi:GPW/gp25 family protein [Lacinutrix chionoecetis]